MSGRKHSSLDRVLGRLDTLDSVNLANLVQRLARERNERTSTDKKYWLGSMTPTDTGRLLGSISKGDLLLSLVERRREPRN